ncbi:MAG: sensor histidine kinase [Bryobacteraceae bacterium]
MFSSIRVRLTIWYLAIFGSLLIAFSVYVYSLLASDLQKQFDTSLHRTAMATANYFTEFVERKNELGGARETVKELQFGELRTAILREGKLLAASGPDVIDRMQSTGIAPMLEAASHPFFATDARGRERLAVVPIEQGGVHYAIVAMEPLQELGMQLARIRRIFFIGIPAALLLAAAGGFLLARKSLEPVVRISMQAERISAKNLHERLNIPNPRDELGKLAGVINALLSRLELSFRVMREFMADASHELRTPIAIIHGEADVTLSRNRTPEDYRESLGIVNRQSNRLGRIVNDMLVLARADSGQQPLRLEEIYLDDLLAECCDAAQTLASAADVRLTLEAEKDISFQGDEELLRRMTLNLLDNAIHYTPAGGLVSAKLVRKEAQVRLSVSDTGIGIPPDCASRVFDRFYRIENSCKSPDGGSGLGLSIVKFAAEAHRGSVDLWSEPGRGSTFTVKLPASS